MNYFVHALPFLDDPFLDDPYFVAGTGVPDWLSVVDRKVRVRLKHAEAFADGGHDPRLTAVARGTAQHVRDDAQFHQTRVFAELSLELTALARDVLDGESSPGFGFLGHLLVEVLLDAAVIAEMPGHLEHYYSLLEAVDEQVVQEAVNQMATRRTVRLGPMISRFREARILWDYLEDGKLMVRLNQVMHRARLPELPDEFRTILPDARQRVACRKEELLEGIPA